MRCKKYLEKFFLSCLVSEIQLFVYIFGRNSKWPPEVQKGSLVKFFDVSYYQIFFSSLQFIKVKIEGVWKCLMIFLFTFVTFSKQIAGLEKKFYSMEWLANKVCQWVLQSHKVSSKSDQKQASYLFTKSHECKQKIIRHFHTPSIFTIRKRGGLKIFLVIGNFKKLD